jgi:hypothetical protein
MKVLDQPLRTADRRESHHQWAANQIKQLVPPSSRVALF